MDYEIYRDGAGKLKDHLQASIQAFYGCHGRLPVAVIVGKDANRKDEAEQTLEEKAQDVLESLGLPDLAVKTTGGCLAGEI